ncbi:hypothetical protein FHY13_000434 [Xanthomonas arboricola]|nr:hypothetical protein [Xanthomonas euroxanthea]
MRPRRRIAVAARLAQARHHGKAPQRALQNNDRSTDSAMRW